MNASELVTTLGAQLGVDLRLSESGTCRVLFDNESVDFEQTGDALYIMADIASASGREDAFPRLLAANCLGRETGGACIGVDTIHDVFTLHVVMYGDTPYEVFEAQLTLFIKALRYWKEWLALPASTSPADTAAAGSEFSPYATTGMIRV